MIHSPNMTDVWQVKSQNQMKLFPLNSHDAFWIYSLILQTSRKIIPKMYLTTKFRKAQWRVNSLDGLATNPSKLVPGSSPPWFLWGVLKQCWGFLTELQFEDHDLREVVLLSFDCLEGKREQYSFLPWHINIHIATQRLIRGKKH